MAGQKAGREAGDRTQRLGGQGHTAPGQPGRVVEFLPALVELAQRAADPGQERGAEAVERHPPPAPLEQRDAELGLQPATAIARDDLPAGQARPAIALIGVTTAAGIGIGYPLVGLLAQYLGVGAAFWLVAVLSAVALVAAAVVLPPSPRRPAHLDLAGAVLLALGIAGLLLVLAQGPAWGWLSPVSVVTSAASLALLAAWAAVERRARHPLVDLRLLRRRPVLAANVTAFLVAIGFYPLGPLVVRYVQTPPGAGYGFGAPVVAAGLMLTPFSLASFAAARVARPLARRSSAELVVAGSCVLLIASMVLFGLARSSYWQLVLAMALDGFGVGCVYAVNPLQITSGVPAHETGSAISFYQLARTVAYAIGSTLSATVLALSIPPGHAYPAYAGYDAAALVCTAVLVVALVTSGLFAVRRDPAGQRAQQIQAN